MNRLALGTVQLGMPYGVANSTGQPDRQEACAMLDFALEHGIEDLDTAPAYGSSEELIGSWNGRSSCRIVTKFKATSIDETPAAQITSSIRRSLDALAIPSLHGYLLHDANAIFDREWIDALARIRDEGRTSKVGVSVYTPQQALAAVSDPRIDIVQVPYSVADRRLERTDFFERARDGGKEVWARSIYLQGLLLMSEDSIPSGLRDIIPMRRLLADASCRRGFTMEETCILHCLCHPGISRTLIGVESLSQLRANISSAERADDFATLGDEIATTMRFDVDERILSPQRWSQP